MQRGHPSALLGRNPLQLLVDADHRGDIDTVLAPLATRIAPEVAPAMSSRWRPGVYSPGRQRGRGRSRPLPLLEETDA